MIVDESHFIKNYKSHRTKSVEKIAKHIPHKLLLTGTPILNRPIELVSQLGILDQIPNFGGFWDFVYRYCSAHKNYWDGWDMSGHAHIPELQEKLRSLCMLRREKKDVLKELPIKQHITVWFKLNNRREYELAKANVDIYIGQKRHEIEKSDYKLIKGNPDNNILRKIVILKHLAGLGKVNAVIEWVENVLEQENELVVFAHHLDVINKIYDHFNNIAVKFTGEMDHIEKDRAVTEFQNGTARLFVGSIRAAGVGLTLTKAHIVAFAELDWNWAWHQQASGRLHRISQTKDVSIYWLLAEDSIEIPIKQMIDQKKDILTELTGKERQ